MHPSRPKQRHLFVKDLLKSYHFLMRQNQNYRKNLAKRKALCPSVLDQQFNPELAPGIIDTLRGIRNTCLLVNHLIDWSKL